MATSLGYVLMNWTSTFSKKKRKKKRNNEEKIPPKKSILSFESQLCQTEDQVCEACAEMSNQMQDLSSDLEQSQMKFRELKKQLNAANLSLAATMEKENELRNKNENLVLEEAQVRYDMDQLRKQISDQLHERDQAHSDRAQLLEKTLAEKECNWAKRNEALRKELRQALRTAIEDTEKEAESLENLEQEIESLRMVVEMRSSENRELRIHNNELMAEVERLAYLETELANSRQRLHEMTLVLQNKMDSERELLELSETLQSELVKSRAENLQLRKNWENGQFLRLQQEEEVLINSSMTSGGSSDFVYQKQRPPFKVQHSYSDLLPPQNTKVIEQHQHQQEMQVTNHRNSHQQASSSGDKNLIMNVREKSESVAWMIQMPNEAISPSNHRRNNNLKSK